MSDRVRHAAIVGGGVTAAMAALALARRIPGLSVSWIDTGIPRDSVEDMAGAARQSLGHFHRMLGLDDRTLLRRAKCGLRHGTLVEEWVQDRFFRSQDRMPAGLPGVPTHLLWLRLSETMEDRIDWIDIASRIGDANGAVPALQLDLDAYREALGALSEGAGIRRVVAATLQVECNVEHSHVVAIRLPGGERISADLYLDSTGPVRSVRGQLPGGWIDWSRQLPTRILSVRRDAPVSRQVGHDRLIAETDGWRLEAYLPHATVSIMGRGDGATSDAAAPSAACISLQPGRLEAPFQGNVVALGSAAVALDPIGATALHLVCRQIERLIAYWPGTHPYPSEIGLYNRRSALDADRMRDFAQLHFTSSRRETPFWRSASAPRSEQLARDLALFGARGRLIPSDEDGFEADEWISTLLGLGHRPAQRDALADALPLSVVRERIAAARNAASILNEEDLR